MTLNERILQKLADWQPTPGSRQTLAVADEEAGWALNLAADRHDELGTAVWEMTLQRRTAPPARAADDLKNWATRAAGRVSGLLETLRVVEVDVQRDEALLRSTEPTRRGGMPYYYEVLLKGLQQATVRRYHGSPEGRREQVAFLLTHEALAKFAADLAAE
jgi:hypothetical protein